MATYSDALRNSQADDWASQFDRLEILDAASVVLATFTITWTAAASGVTSVDLVPITTTGLSTGTADSGRFYDNTTQTFEAENITVGTANAEIVMNTTSIETGKDVDLISFTYTAPTASDTT